MLKLILCAIVLGSTSAQSEQISLARQRVEQLTNKENPSEKTLGVSETEPSDVASVPNDQSSVVTSAIPDTQTTGVSSAIPETQATRVTSAIRETRTIQQPVVLQQDNLRNILTPFILPQSPFIQSTPQGPLTFITPNSLPIQPSGNTLPILSQNVAVIDDLRDGQLQDGTYYVRLPDATSISQQSTGIPQSQESPQILSASSQPIRLSQQQPLRPQLTVQQQSQQSSQAQRSSQQQIENIRQQQLIRQQQVSQQLHLQRLQQNQQQQPGTLSQQTSNVQFRPIVLQQPTQPQPVINSNIAVLSDDTRATRQPQQSVTAVQQPLLVRPVIARDQQQIQDQNLDNINSQAQVQQQIRQQDRSVVIQQTRPTQQITRPTPSVIGDIRHGPYQDGTYYFRCLTSDGKQREEGARLKESGTHEVTGSYSYVAPDGTLVAMEYIADENGYRAFPVRPGRVNPVKPPEPIPVPPPIRRPSSPVRLEGVSTIGSSPPIPVTQAARPILVTPSPASNLQPIRQPTRSRPALSIPFPVATTPSPQLTSVIRQPQSFVNPVSVVQDNQQRLPLGSGAFQIISSGTTSSGQPQYFIYRPSLQGLPSELSPLANFTSSNFGFSGNSGDGGIIIVPSVNPQFDNIGTSSSPGTFVALNVPDQI
ncbi:hypothetical protein SK128_006053 [Halocaridina rubra]|uniref:Uncharacterized protein n=1 Tax=Halocaridina rubra TaxID=373956 RepID=A0AAN8XLW8_HALRR